MRIFGMFRGWSFDDRPAPSPWHAGGTWAAGAVMGVQDSGHVQDQGPGLLEPCLCLDCQVFDFIGEVTLLFVRDDFIPEIHMVSSGLSPQHGWPSLVQICQSRCISFPMSGDDTKVHTASYSANLEAHGHRGTHLAWLPCQDHGGIAKNYEKET